MRSPLFIVVFVLLMLAAAVLGRKFGRRAEAPSPLPPASSRAPAPAFAVNTLAGQPWSLAALRGQVVVVNFFATWCPPCRAEMPDLVSLAHDYRARGVAVLGLALDEGGAAVVAPFVQQQKIDFPVALPPPGGELTAGIEGIPVTWLIDKSGRIARARVGRISPVAVRADLDALVAESP